MQFRANSLRSFWQWCLPRPERDLHTVPASSALRLLRSVPVAFATRTFQMHIDHRGLRPRWSGVKPCEANLGSRFVSGFNLLAHETYETGYPRPSGMWPRLPASGPLRSTSNRSQHSDDESIHQGVISCVPSNMDLAATRDRSTRPTIPITMRVTLRRQEPKNSCAVGFCRRNLIASTSGNLALHLVLGFSGPRLGRPWICVYPKGTPCLLYTSDAADE